MCRANWENPALIAAMQATRAVCRHFEVRHVMLLPPKDLRSCLLNKSARESRDPFYSAKCIYSNVNIQDMIAYL
jgi:hypothetical protein